MFVNFYKKSLIWTDKSTNKIIAQNLFKLKHANLKKKTFTKHKNLKCSSQKHEIEIFDRI